MGFDPTGETSFEILRNLPAAGADVIELGFAFSDPMADGVSIQRGGRKGASRGRQLARNARSGKAFPSGRLGNASNLNGL
ncbi:MAG: tryptophan synthase subunit alpha [Alphaproteobacteria bacterium]